MNENTKKILTYSSIGLLIGVGIAVLIQRRNAKKNPYTSNATNNKLDAEMEALIKKIGEAKK